MSISIIIPTYMRPQFLGRLLASIVLQSYKDFEVIIIDDNSTNTHDYEIVVEKYNTLIPAMTFVRNEVNRGAPYSRNRGIRLAKYDLIALVDDDDEWLPFKLQEQVRVFQQGYENLGIVYSWADSIDEKGNVIHRYRGEVEGKALSSMLSNCFIPSPSVLVRNKALIDAGLFDESLPSCQDWDMWTRILSKGYEVRVVRKVLALYHKHTSDSIGTSARARAGYCKYYRKHFWRLVRFRKARHLLRYFRLITRI